MDKNVLIIEDEKAISDIVAFNLNREGYKVEQSLDGIDGFDKALNSSPDLILLDVMLPGMDGFEILKRLRMKSNVPVIMLTARDEEADKVLGLDIGADDYITKPFSIKELLARVKANMRRAATDDVPEKNSENTLNFGELSIDSGRHQVMKNGGIIDLTVREYELLTYLAAEPEKVISREELMEKVWGYEYYGDLRAVDVAIRRLREKLEDNPAEPKWIITKRGIGYYFKGN